MSLETPFGLLSEIDIENTETLKEIMICSDKSRMLEGMVIEDVFSGVISKLKDQKIDVVPVSVIKGFRACDNKPNSVSWWVLNNEQPCELVYSFMKKATDLSGDRNSYLLQCYYDKQKKDFLFTEGDLKGKSVQQTLQDSRKQENIAFVLPDQTVIDENRSDKAFSTFFDSRFGRISSLFNEIILPRFFKNFALQPFFNGIWDIDSIIRMPDGSFVQLEVKHKYPRKTLEFGINKGQIYTMQDLARKNIRTMHIVMVKPVWDKNFGTGYLMNRMDLREKVLIIGKLLDSKALWNLSKRDDHSTGKEQSLSGKTDQKTKYLKASEFNLLGTLDDSVSTIAENIRLTIEGKYCNPVTEDMLYKAKTDLDCL
jgi:hypothetical protein